MCCLWQLCIYVLCHVLILESRLQWNSNHSERVKKNGAYGFIIHIVHLTPLVDFCLHDLICQQKFRSIDGNTAILKPILLWNDTLDKTSKQMTTSWLWPFRWSWFGSISFVNVWVMNSIMMLLMPQHLKMGAKVTCHLRGIYLKWGRVEGGRLAGGRNDRGLFAKNLVSLFIK